MTNSIAVASTNPTPSEDDMFPDLEPLSIFDVKKDSVSTQLAALMSYCGKTRSAMAHELGWKKSRVSSVLSGHNNLTLKTICDFSIHLGYDFDLIFHGPNQQRPRQPWQIQRGEEINLPIESLQTLTLPIETQSAHEVAIDLLSGNAKEVYFSFNTQHYDSVPQLPVTVQTNSIPTQVDPRVIHELWR